MSWKSANIVASHILFLDFFISVIFLSSFNRLKKKNLKKIGVACTHEDILRGDEGMLFNGGQDITKLDFCREGVSVVDDWHSVWTIPAVHWK